MKKLLILPLLVLSLLESIAQIHPCNFNTYMNARYKEDPSLLEMRKAYEIEIQQIINSKSSFAQKTIPVVIHIIFNDSYSNISTTQVNSALIAINEDFNASNSDFNSVVSAFSGIKSNLDIKFELANLDPNGNTTTGITRTESDFTDNAGENVKGLVIWDPNMYLNIWVVDNIESGAGAYAYYPGTAPSGNEGIVTRHSQFGTTGTSSSSNFAATTLTHEVGHYLNLSHTWGDSNDAELEDNCNYDDNVEDTPNTIGTLYGCNTNQSTCGSLDNVQNFMDYTDCTNMFSNGQRARAHAALHSAQGGRVNLWQQENLIATGILENTSCTTELITVQIHTGTYANEVSWIVLDGGGEGIAGGGGTYTNDSDYYTSVCLAQGSYTFQSLDSYGDGWNGGYYNVRNCDNVIIANNSNPSGYGTTESFVVAECGSISGCTNPVAANYSQLANEDDGSCIILGCLDFAASNYNPEANQDNETCIYIGCTDATALNFDPQANSNDDSCEFVEVPDVFNYTLTGANHTLVIPDNIVFNLVDAPISNSDIIGVFYNDENGIEKCSGYIVWQGETLSIAVQGDDTTTDEIDGYQEGETFVLKVWDQSENLYYYCEVHYLQSMPNQGEYTTNGISAITDGVVVPPVTSQLINFPLGWGIISCYLVLEDMDIANVLNPINESIIIAKDFQGAAYLSEWGFNGIGTMIYGSAYQVKTSQEENLEVYGVYNEPEEAQIILPLGWSLFGYLRTQAASCSAVFESIADIEIIKNASGNAYLPVWDFNGIGDLTPGWGYQIKMNNQQTLQYNSNTNDY